MRSRIFRHAHHYRCNESGASQSKTIRHNQARCENVSNNVQNFGGLRSQSSNADCSGQLNYQEKKTYPWENCRECIWRCYPFPSLGTSSASRIFLEFLAFPMSIRRYLRDCHDHRPIVGEFMDFCVSPYIEENKTVLERRCLDQELLAIIPSIRQLNLQAKT
jgi:hypothetical protein